MLCREWGIIFAIMQDKPTREELVDLVRRSNYAIFSALDANGLAYSFPVYVRSGHCLSFYWLSTMDAQHSRVILEGKNQISGLIMDTTHPQGMGFALSFNGVATCFENPNEVASHSPFPAEYEEAKKMIKSICDQSNTLKGKECTLMEPNSPRKLFRVMLTKAWCNGTVSDPKTNLALDRRFDVPIIQDAGTYIRRYLGEPTLSVKNV